MPTLDDDTWSDDALLETASEYSGVGSDVDLDDIDRFRASVSRLVARTLTNRRGADAGISVFLLEPGGPPPDLRDRCARVPMLDRAREPLEHRLWFVTHVVTVGHWLPARFEQDDDLFRYVVEEVGLGGVPAVLFDARDPGPELRYYPRGLADADEVEPLTIAYTVITLDDIFRRIDLVYENQLVTPGAQPRGARLWADSSRFIAASNAEDVLSALLSVGLQTAFPTCKVRVEQPAPVGRLDIELEERTPERRGGVVKHAILELKILRGRNPNGTRVSGGRIDRWVSDGVTQAAAYREDKSAAAGALCCFDMRETYTDRQCFAHVVELAEELDIELNVWHLFASAAAYRSHLRASGKLSSAVAHASARSE
jgi:hypothetical protein